MPVYNHAFTTQKKTWEDVIKQDSLTSKILSRIFGEEKEREISRAELFKLAKGPDLKEFIITTILWGYPAGMRGNNFNEITKNLNALEQCLIEAKESISDWDKHYKNVQAIAGIGLSTYSKLLYFCKAKVNDIPCVILDRRIINSVKKGAISGLESLHKITPENASRHYPEYLKVIHAAANKYETSHGNVEMFIFLFGRHIKRHIHSSNHKDICLSS